MSYRLEIKINVPIENVWKAWSKSSEAVKWLSYKSNINFVENGQYEFFWDDDPEIDSTLGCTLLSIKDHTYFQFEWQGKNEYLYMFQPPYSKTNVEVFFQDLHGSTSLIVGQKETRDLEHWSEYDSWMKDAWEYALQQLKTYLEKG